MPVKRSRIGSKSSSFREAGVLSPPPLESADGGWMGSRVGVAQPPPPSAAAAAAAKPPRNSAKAMKPYVEEKSAESRSRILTLSSPVKENMDASDEATNGGFLDKCFYCEKKIPENAEVFMYSYLRAFCTVECRDRQIAMDNDKEKAFGKSTGNQT